ncbi:MAG: acyl-CoA dehydrogenase family protein [Desulfobacterales bacterium]|nr:acyl-CoA dehydrogenase family protein [Desulfobacterales bacterium]
MDFTLSKSQKEIKKAAWEFARGKFDKEMIIEQSKAQTFPLDILEKAGELGFIGIHFDEAYEGGGLGLFEDILVSETFCRKDSTLGAALKFSAYAAECILRFGDKALKETFIPAIAGGQRISTGAFLEPDPGYDLSAVKTTAEKDPDGWIINGVKSHVPLGDQADIHVVLCATDPTVEPRTKGMSMLLVESDREGVFTENRTEKLGGRMVPFAPVRFENVRVPPTHLIGSEGMGYKQLERFLIENRIQIAAMALGTAQGAFDRALAYIKEREQFGKKLAQFQITRHKIADMANRIEGARYLTYYAATCFDQGKASNQMASMAKLTATETAMAVTDESVQMLGGYGYMTEYEVEHFYRDAKHAEIFQGTPGVQKDIIADEVIGKLKP